MTGVDIPVSEILPLAQDQIQYNKLTMRIIEIRRNKSYILPIVFLVLVSSCRVVDDNTENIWNVSDPILFPGPKGSVDEFSVKDPSIVFFEGMWHLFFTARSETEYTTSYVSAKELTGLQSARRHELEMIRGKSRYGCAPQVFYFEPQNKMASDFPEP